MHMHVQGHARNQISPGGSKTDFTEPEHHGKGPVSLQIQRGEGDEIILLCRGGADQWRNAFDRSCMKFRARSSPCRMVATFLFLLFLLFFFKVDTSHILCTQAALEGFVRRTISDCDFDSGSSVAGLERGGDSTIQMSCCRL
ncbi:hypothetical protein BO85DRAFT_250972 [Aspergillus piperis CBS 112811]|uniref:Uncharacterized protein n=1 Tax=Aspergillus piperis CBS 112811 TaxID=1448313 RepID=A0A8G1R595_9EURO|nr:hypothetical protein BO85DRAFT_250972 [Aspergillus piperis CBS 112811]RAH59818.1 hypothetical protein BO85DRAFT_250972 [Aspergillus piperis CBS 112811]